MYICTICTYAQYLKQKQLEEFMLRTCSCRRPIQTATNVPVSNWVHVLYPRRLECIISVRSRQYCDMLDYIDNTYEIFSTVNVGI